MDETHIPQIFQFWHEVNKLKALFYYKSSVIGPGGDVADHAWRLAFLVFVVAKELSLDLDCSHAMGLALIHDLFDMHDQDIRIPELVIDTNLFREDAPAHASNRLRDMAEEYAEQKTLEAKFVQALDKVETFLHLNEDGSDIYIPPIFHENYADEAVKSFDEAMDMFVPLAAILQPLKRQLKEKFATLGVKWVDNR